MTANDWAVWRGGLALFGAILGGIGISFVAQPPLFSLIIALFGLVLLFTLAPRRHWKQLAGRALFVAGSVGLLSLAIRWARPPIAAEAQQDTWSGYLIRGLVYAMFLALGWAERRHRARAAIG